MDKEQTAAPVYDRFYYLRYFGPEGKLEYTRSQHWLDFFGYIAERIVSDIGPASVLDAGCAMGILVESLRDRGVDAYGIDVSDYALENVRQDVKPYCANASVTEPLPRMYDVITCIETLEHLHPADAEKAVANLCVHTDDIIFSSTPSHFKEATHLNVRPPEYWAELFGRHGLYRDVDYDPSTYIAAWAVRFRRQRDPAPRIAGNYERMLWRLKSENQGLRELGLEGQAELANASARIDEMKGELYAARQELELTRTTATWHLAHRMSRVINGLLPPGTRRRALAGRMRPKLTPRDGDRLS